MNNSDIASGLRRLPAEFFQKETLGLVPDVLGKILVRRSHGTILAGRIVEVEAYIGDDPASHAAHGMTDRNRVMFGDGGVAYVYFTYGMHFCFNIVTDRKGFPAALLVRALEPIHGIDGMKKRRGRSDPLELTNGPAKLCQAMGIDRSLNGVRLDGDRLYVADDGFRLDRKQIGVSPRIGIKVGVEKKWRFYVKGNGYVSGYQPRKKTLKPGRKIT